MSDLSFPAGWISTTLGSIIELKYGKSLPATSRDGGCYPVFGSNGIVGGHSEPLVNKAGIIVGRKGSYGEVQLSESPFYPIDTTYFVDDLYDQPLMYWYYQLKYLPLTELNRSTAIPGLNREDAYAQAIVLPPLAEQKVIADKLDTLLTQVEITKARLDRIPEILKSFRQSVLSAAVSGKLIEITDDDLTECFLSDVSCFQNGYAFKSDWFSDRGDYQVIKLGNVKDDYLKLDAAPAFLSNELASDYIKFKPDIGDILLSMTGTKFKRDYGFACVVNKELPILINQRVGRIIPDKDKVSPGFLHLFLRSDAFRDQFFEGETGGVNQGNVGSKHIMMCKLSLPNLGNQSQITEKARLLLDYADTVETQVNNALARVNNLTQSILGKAFRGELTADWRAANPELISGDNSAAALLDKIKAERALLNKKKRG